MNNSVTDSPPAAVSDIRAVVLARYGVTPQVARFSVSATVADKGMPTRGQQVVVRTERGPELAEMLEVVRQTAKPDTEQLTGEVLRLANAADLQQYAELRREADNAFPQWQQRLAEWKLQLQLIDLEWTLDHEQLILYVLNSQNAETTRLALLAAAAGLGIVTVQPVAAQGIIPLSSGSGCGSGGCGSGGCGQSESAANGLENLWGR